MHRPPSIILFERLFWSSILVSVVTTIVTWSNMAAEFDREAGAGRSAGSFGVVFVILVISLAIVLALWYAIARRGSNVAKWIYVVLTAIGTLQALAALFGPAETGALSLAGSLLSTALSVASAAMLFRADAVAWLSGKPPVDPGVFN